MLILLTDLLACPRCGPDFGLVVLADRLEDRRVLEGVLGCPNCREHYPVRGGVADLRLPARGAALPEPEAGADPETALRLAALMGVARVSGMVVVAGPAVRHAAALAELAPELEVVAVGERPAPGGTEARVSRVLAAPGRLPFRDGMLRGGALTGGDVDADGLREGLRVLAPGTRLVVEPAPPETAARLGEFGAKVILDQAGAVVAEVPGRPVDLLRNAVR